MNPLLDRISLDRIPSGPSALEVAAIGLLFLLPGLLASQRVLVVGGILWLIAAVVVGVFVARRSTPEPTTD